jgi:membrane-associated phospholipid phosphatase
MAGISSLALGVMVQNDERLRRPIQGNRSEGRDEFWDGVSTLGRVEVPLGIALLGMTLSDGPFAELSAAAVQSLALTGLTILALKPLTASVRPGIDSSRRQFFSYETRSFDALSFPSGHTMGIFAVAEVYGSAYGRWWTYPLAAMVGYSRIHGDWHWASDVLAGALLGIAAARSTHTVARARGAAGRWWGLGRRGDTPVLAAGLEF